MRDQSCQALYNHLWRTTPYHVWWEIRRGAASIPAYCRLRDGVRQTLVSDLSLETDPTCRTVRLRPVRMRIRGNDP